MSTQHSVEIFLRYQPCTTLLTFSDLKGIKQETLENAVGKEENAGNQHFSGFPHNIFIVERKTDLRHVLYFSYKMLSKSETQSIFMTKYERMPKLLNLSLTGHETRWKMAKMLLSAFSPFPTLFSKVFCFTSRQNNGIVQKLPIEFVFELVVNVLKLWRNGQGIAKVTNSISFSNTSIRVLRQITQKGPYGNCEKFALSVHGR